MQGLRSCGSRAKFGARFFSDAVRIVIFLCKIAFMGLLSTAVTVFVQKIWDSMAKKV